MIFTPLVNAVDVLNVLTVRLRDCVALAQDTPMPGSDDEDEVASLIESDDDVLQGCTSMERWILIVSILVPFSFVEVDSPI